MSIVYVVLSMRTLYTSAATKRPESPLLLDHSTDQTWHLPSVPERTGLFQSIPDAAFGVQMLSLSLINMFQTCLVPPIKQKK